MATPTKPAAQRPSSGRRPAAARKKGEVTSSGQSGGSRPSKDNGNDLSDWLPPASSAFGGTDTDSPESKSETPNDAPENALLAVGIGAGLLALAAWAFKSHVHELAEVNPHAEPVSPHVGQVMAEMDAFFAGGGGDFKAAKEVGYERIHYWALRLQAAWPSLSEESRQQFLDSPKTWQLIQQRWPSLDAQQRALLKDHWLPDLPVFIKP